MPAVRVDDADFREAQAGVARLDQELRVDEAAARLELDRLEYASLEQLEGKVDIAHR